jgi:ubiquinone/menaquinone biosynthesis C-methylase UbiE
LGLYGARRSSRVRVRSVILGSGRPAEHAQVFGQVADVYDRTRPDYPAAAVEWLAGSEQRRVLDLGAGTGKLTAALVTAGHDVVAVEPLAQMLAILRTSVPDAAALEGRAEAIPLPDADVDVVVVAQAFHWFDHERAVPEIARVLRPSGRLALVWNLRDESRRWAAELSRVIGSADASLAEVTPAVRAAARPHFDAFDTARFRHAQRLDREMLLGLVKSRSYVAVRPVGQQNAIFAQVAALFDRFAESGELTMPYVTHCYRASRR